MGCIYKITNNKNNKLYIGYTTEAGEWCIENNLSKGKHPNADISKRCSDNKKAFGYYWRYLEEDVETMVETSRTDDGLLSEVQNKEQIFEEIVHSY